jgi:hypothetical protein
LHGCQTIKCAPCLIQLIRISIQAKHEASQLGFEQAAFVGWHFVGGDWSERRTQLGFNQHDLQPIQKHVTRDEALAIAERIRIADQGV